MGLKEEKMLAQLTIEPVVEVTGDKYKFKLVVSWPVMKFQQALGNKILFDSQMEAVFAADHARDLLRESLIQHYIGKRLLDD